MRLLDVLRNAGRAGREVSELSRLQGRLERLSSVIEQERGRLVDRCIERTVAPELKDQLRGVLSGLLTNVLAFEGLFTRSLPGTPLSQMSTSEVWARISDFNRRLAALENSGFRDRIEETLAQIICNILRAPETIGSRRPRSGRPKPSA